MSGESAGAVRSDNGIDLKLVWCPRGFVTMEQVKLAVPESDPAGEEPDAGVPKGPTNGTAPKFTPVKVFLSQGYWIGQREVTQGEWKKIVERIPWKGQQYVKEDDESPATYVSWHQAMEFCEALTARERDAGRLPANWEYTLPSEAQWERSCRAQTETTFSFGNDESDLDEYAWFWKNSWQGKDKFPRAVGQKRANPWNIHDMHGNVWEWCRDSWSDRLPGGRDPLFSEPEQRHVMRGGACCDLAELCRSGYRFGRGSKFQGADLGFRVVLTLSR
jgi:formylglycine-generating enzyme required for sulfatase activity